LNHDPLSGVKTCINISRSLTLGFLHQITHKCSTITDIPTHLHILYPLPPHTRQSPKLRRLFCSSVTQHFQYPLTNSSISSARLSRLSGVRYLWPWYSNQISFCASYSSLTCIVSTMKQARQCPVCKLWQSGGVKGTVMAAVVKRASQKALQKRKLGRNRCGRLRRL